MFLGDWLGSLLGGLVVGVVGDWRRRRAHSRAEADAAQAEPVRLTVALRRLDRRFVAGRWRHGKAVVRPGEIRWAPRWPRMGRRFALRDVVFADRRRSTIPEQWFLNAGLVIVECSAATGRYELAVFPEDMRFLRPEVGDRLRPVAGPPGA
ncbi:DUF2550 family protein [Micromonospora sp. NPDC007271]|uniref:DUF2550 family protein n=1 Tax=Micromonospora sp. NPDC007271 TaxID=3154587 RepID=UPI0033E0C25E